MPSVRRIESSIKVPTTNFCILYILIFRPLRQMNLQLQTNSTQNRLLQQRY